MNCLSSVLDWFETSQRYKSPNIKDTHKEGAPPKLNSSAYENYEYGHMSRCYIKLALFKRF